MAFAPLHEWGGKEGGSEGGRACVSTVSEQSAIAYNMVARVACL